MGYGFWQMQRRTINLRCGVPDIPIIQVELYPVEVTSQGILEIESHLLLGVMKVELGFRP